MNMRTLILIFILLVSTQGSASNWMTSYENAQKLAIATNKLIVVDFWATWCGPCKKMDREAWQDPQIERLLENYIPLKIDIDRSRQLADLYGIKSIPYVFILDGNGEVVFKSLGYMDKKEVQQVLEKYSVKTSFLGREAMNYFKHQNYITSIMLADKYLDFSLYLNENIRTDFVGLALEYLNKADKFLEKNQSNYLLMNQKIELLELTAELYRGNFRKVERNLEKINSQELDDLNKNQYYFLKYCLAKEQNHQIKDEIKSQFNSENFVVENQKKVSLLFKESFSDN